jgi:hypothetical protein
MAGADDRANRGVLLGLALLAAFAAITFIRYHPPAPRPTTAPPSQFSADRALEVLFQLVGDGVPHPVGSAENAAVRDRIVKYLTQLGYRPELQPGFACNEWGSCGAVKNIIARLDGTEPGSSVLLAAHYDSVPAGPGASDDGMSAAAVLEIARVLKTLPTPRHSIILLISDGEEAGMLGAEVFTESHRWARDVKVAINLEARGTSGPSLMFETGSANEWAVRLFAGSVRHPITNSIYYEVYKRLPNDTDFSVFKAAGYQGLNFAIIGDVTHYHTPLDNFEYVSASSLQHQGDNGLAAVLAFANTEIENPSDGEAVYFDVLARSLVIWTDRASFPIAATIAFLLLVEIAWLFRRQALSISSLFWGLFGWFGMALFTGVIGFVLLEFYRVTGAMPPRRAEYGWIAHPHVAQVAFAALAFANVFIVARVFQKRARFWGFWAAGNVLFAAAAIESSRAFAGASFIFVVIVSAAVVGALPAVLDAKDSLWRREIAALVPAAAAFAMFLPSIWFLYDALGVGILPAVAVLLTLVVATLAPLLVTADEGTRRGLSGLAVTIAIFAGAIALIVPVYSVRAPQRVNFQYWLDADSHQAKWLAETNSQRLPDWLAAAAAFKKKPQPAFPWDPYSRFGADAPQLDLAAPELTVLTSEPAGAGVRYHIRIISPRGAPDCSIYFPGTSGVSAIEIAGRQMPATSARVLGFLNDALHGWRMYEIATLPAEGIEMSFTLPSAAPAEAFLVDQSYALPSDGAFLRTARPSDAVPSQDGDVTIVSRRFEIRPLSTATAGAN